MPYYQDLLASPLFDLLWLLAVSAASSPGIDLYLVGLLRPYAISLAKRSYIRSTRYLADVAAADVIAKAGNTSFQGRKACACTRRGGIAFIIISVLS